MSIGETISAGLMIMGLVLGAMTGAIAMLLIPVAAGVAGFGITFCFRMAKHERTITSQIPYPPYGY